MILTIARFWMRWHHLIHDLSEGVTAVKEGWVLPLATYRKAKRHYFRDNRSLCGQVGYSGVKFDSNQGRTRGDCQLCCRALSVDPLDEDVCRVGGLAMSNSREDWLSDKVDLLESDVERMRFHKAVLLWTLIMENVLLWLLAWWLW
jgi:hypothetical protein